MKASPFATDSYSPHPYPWGHHLVMSIPQLGKPRHREAEFCSRL